MKQTKRKWNIVDVVIVLVVVALLAFGVWKLIGGRGGTSNDNTTGITYTVKVYGLEQEMFQSVQKSAGEELMASTAPVDGKIVKVEQVPSRVYTSLNSFGTTPVRGQVQTGENDQLVDAVFTIEANADVDAKGEVFTVGPQEIRVGRSHIVKTEHLEVTGMIITVDWGE